MIDLHCHILPGLDDGALDLVDSLAMARVAERDGIAVVCATPHIRDDHAVRIEELPQRVAELQRELDRHEVTVRIAVGGEVAQPAADRLSDEHLRAVSLDGCGWILLEPSAGPLAGDLTELARHLHGRGANVLVAHPERHAGADFLERLRELVAHGCLIQWTADFFARIDPGERDSPMLAWAREGLVHVLASDAHSSHGGRTVRLSEGVERLRGALAPEQVDWIAEQAPAAILRGDRVTPPWGPGAVA